MKLPIVLQNIFTNKVGKAVLFAVGGDGISQVLRLIGNLILTRLLFPEVFGVMALVQTCVIGVSMFSDIGVDPCIIQSKRGDEKVFLDTAWTSQIVRGLVLWGACILLANPAADFFSEPMMASLLPFVGFNAVLDGFSSTKFIIAKRNIDLFRITVLEIGSYVVSLIVMVTIAYFNPTVWALVWGSLSGRLVRMICTHLYLEGMPNRLCFEKEAGIELFKFGRWIFFGTAVTFLAMHGDKLVLGKFLSVSFLAYYMIASNLSKIIATVVSKVGGTVLFPAYSELLRQDKKEQLYKMLRKARIIQLLCNYLLSIGFILFGQLLIDLLYDDRYSDAGWILRFLALAPLMGSLNDSYHGILLGHGKVRVDTYLLVLRLVFSYTLMIVGFKLHGEVGFVVGFILTEWFLYPVNSFIFSKLSLWQPEVDFPAISIAAIIWAVFFLVF